MLDNSFPEPLLRATSDTIKATLQSGAGLEPVIQSSGFNLTAVMKKMEAISASSESKFLSKEAELQLMFVTYDCSINRTQAAACTSCRASVSSPLRPPRADLDERITRCTRIFPPSRRFIADS